MQFLKPVKTKLSSIQNLSLQGYRSRIVIVIGLTLAYILIFYLFIDRLGLFVSIFLILPVSAAGYHFGRTGGFIAGLCALALNILLLTVFENYTYLQAIRYWPGYLVILAIGYFAGYLRDEALARRRMSSEVNSRERFIALVSIATKGIVGTKRPEDAYFRLITHLTNLFVADYAYLIRWDEANEQASLIAATKLLEGTSLPVALESGDANLVEAVLQSRHSMVIEDVQKSAYMINPHPFKDLAFQTKSALVIPLTMEDYCFGVVTLAFDSPRRFTTEEIVYVELASSQITLALRTLQQQLEIESQLREAKALANIERALSESERVGVDKVLQLIVDSAIELIPKAKNVILHLLDDEKQVLVPRAVAGIREIPKGQLNMRPGEGVAGQVMATGRVINIADIRTDERFLNQTIPVKFRSLVVAPIKSHEECIGTISIHSDAAHAFNDNEVTLLETLGTQVSIGIDNANLLETTQKNLAEINILYRISQVLATSLDADQLMKNVATLLQQNFEYQNVIIFAVDPESGELIARQGSGAIAARLIKQGYRLPVGAGIAGHVAKTGEPFVTNDVDNEAFHVPHPFSSDIKYELAVPISIENQQVIGVLDIQQTSSLPLARRQLELLSAVADQLAIALNRIDILGSLEQRVQQRTHDLVVLYNLITIISENWRLQDLLELSLVLTLETMKADRGIIYLGDGKEPPGLKPVIQRGFAEGFQITPGSLPDDELAGRVFEQHKSLTLDNLAEIPAYAKFKGLNSYAGIPIMVRGEMRGVFSLFGNKKGVFGPDEMALLTSIADHLGIGIENSILFEQSRDSAVLEERNRLARNLHDSVTQLLYSLTLMAGSTQKMLERGHDLGAIKNSVARLGDTAQQALKEMRLLLYELRPAVLDSEGLISALQHRIETVEERLGVKVDLQANNVPELPNNIEDALYHIALEALNNIVKHSGSTMATIRFTKVRGDMVMEISDRGKGFDPNQPHKGLGLRNMRERGQMLGGEIFIDSKPGSGTQVTVKVSIPSSSLDES